MIFLFRKSSGQVLIASTDNTNFAGSDPTYFGTVIDPPQPDGADLGIPKIWDGTNLRNATALEISNFPTFTATDVNLQNRTAAIVRLQTDVVFRKVLRAIVGQVVVQLNVLRTNPAIGLAAITEAQAENAIVNAINAGTFD